MIRSQVSTANQVPFDNDGTGLSAVAVGEALVEIAEALEARQGCWRTGASAITLSDTTWDEATLNVEVENSDDANHFAINLGSDSEVVVKKAGRYHVWAKIQFDTTATDWSEGRAMLKVNGTEVVGTEVNQEVRQLGAYSSCFTALEVELAADDTVAVVVRKRQSGDDIRVAGSGGLILGIHRIPGL